MVKILCFLQFFFLESLNIFFIACHLKYFSFFNTVLCSILGFVFEQNGSLDKQLKSCRNWLKVGGRYKTILILTHPLSCKAKFVCTMAIARGIQTKCKNFEKIIETNSTQQCIYGPWEIFYFIFIKFHTLQVPLAINGKQLLKQAHDMAIF